MIFESIVGVMLEESLAATVFAPKPSPQPVACVMLHLGENRTAVGVMEVVDPSLDHSIDLLHRLLHRLMLGPVVEELAQLLAQFGLALGVGFDMRIALG